MLKTIINNTANGIIIFEEFLNFTALAYDLTSSGKISATNYNNYKDSINHYKKMVEAFYNNENGKAELESKFIEEHLSRAAVDLCVDLAQINYSKLQKINDLTDNKYCRLLVKKDKAIDENLVKKLNTAKYLQNNLERFIFTYRTLKINIFRVYDFTKSCDICDDFYENWLSVLELNKKLYLLMLESNSNFKKDYFDRKLLDAFDFVPKK